MQRHGYTEECYFDFTFTPVYGESGTVDGVFNAVIETTKTILNERQLRTLTQLGKALIDSHSSLDVVSDTIHTLKANPYDVPFALFYSIVHNRAILSASSPLADMEHLIPKEVDLNSRGEMAVAISEALATGKLRIVEGTREKIGELSKGAWEISPDKAIFIPIMQAGMNIPYGVLVAGLNPLRLPDENYINFFSLLADQMAKSFTQAHVREQERKRAEALAEVDKAKTTFFTNISHEFRTPLTLMLGNLEEILADPETPVATRNRMNVAHRSAMRLLRLVNTLLDFSRLEAGRVKATYQLTDIAAFTYDLASNFRSTIENAGLKFEVLCDPVTDPVYIDREMWEKIVFNLLSNAFKYTLEGYITLSLIGRDGEVDLKVKDSGVGIPNSELSKVFQRFHRVENVTGRTFEGTGIGLSLVKELVLLHGGYIEVSSKEGEGSTFTITLPTGKAHLRSEQVTDEQYDVDGTIADSFIAESLALAEIPVSEGENEAIPDAATVLVVDDNADMRSYIRGLLQREVNVVMANDGAEALNKISGRKIDLVLSDIMMPVVDGIELVQTIKKTPKTSMIPVILISARAGEEARVEGYDIGADDYITKPFSAKELIARVRAQVALAKKRNDAYLAVYNLFNEVPFAVAVLKGASLIIEYANKYTLDLWERKREEVIDKPLFEVIPGTRAGVEQVHNEVYRTGNRIVANEMAVDLSKAGETGKRYFNAIIDPLFNDRGEIVGQLATTIEVTEQVLARKNIEESEGRFRTLAETLPQLVWVTNEKGEQEYASKRWENYTGIQPSGIDSWRQMVHPEDLKLIEAAWRHSLETGGAYKSEARLKNKEGEYRWHFVQGEPIKDAEGKIVKWIGAFTDIHDQKALMENLERLVTDRTRELKQSNEDLQQFAHVASHDLKEPVRKVITFSGRLEKEMGDRLDDKAKIYLKKVQSAADRMVFMIDGVLNYSTLNAASEKPEKVDLNSVFDSIETDLELMIKRTGTVIKRNGLPCINGAPVLIYQLFYNLVNNSIKFVRAGITPQIDITSEIVLENNTELVRIVFRDNGIGFTQDQAKLIFDTFIRLNSKDKYEGTGLGLALCKKIVERHGGSIEAKGVIDEGAIFTINFPLNPGKSDI